MKKSVLIGIIVGVIVLAVVGYIIFGGDKTSSSNNTKDAESGSAGGKTQTAGESQIEQESDEAIELPLEKAKECGKVTFEKYAEWKNCMLNELEEYERIQGHEGKCIWFCYDWEPCNSLDVERRDCESINCDSSQRPVSLRDCGTGETEDSGETTPGSNPWINNFPIQDTEVNCGDVGGFETSGTFNHETDLTAEQKDTLNCFKVALDLCAKARHSMAGNEYKILGKNGENCLVSGPTVNPTGNPVYITITCGFTQKWINDAYKKAEEEYPRKDYSKTIYALELITWYSTLENGKVPLSDGTTETIVCQ